jgi:ABC-type phosphate transport system substrate-binding protein
MTPAGPFAAISARQVDFGASDVPMTASELTCSAEAYTRPRTGVPAGPVPP